MREMKDSGVAWIGEIPARWGINRLKSFALTHFGGCWGDDAKGNENDVLCIRIADFDFSSQTVKESASTMRNYTQAQIEKGLLKDGDLIIEKSGGGDKTPVGRVVVYEKSRFPKAMFANFSECLRPKNIDNKFLAYQLKALYYSVDMHYYFNQTTGLQNLDMQTYLNAMMCFPTMEEQQKIAAHLDRKCTQIDALISNAQQQIEKLKAYKQSVITETVTKGLDPDVAMKDSGVEWIGEIPEHWEVIRLKFLLQYIIDCPADEDYGFLRADEQMYRLDEKEYKHRIRRLSLDKDDIVYGREGERWGLACIVPESNKYCLGQRMMQFRCNEHIVPMFIMWALNSKNIYVQGCFDTLGSTSPHVNISTIINYEIPIPSYEEQNKLASFLQEKCSQIDKLIALKQQKIEKLQQYKKSLIYEYVTGKKEV